MQNPDRWDDRPYLQRGLDVTSQFVNVALANGMPDESLSGRAHRNTVMRVPVKRRWRLVAACAELIFWPIDRGNHCRAAYEQDIERSRLRAGVLP